ncbi:MAG: CRTAC1 family protein [candidate division Zixibacteria bacterium]|nr:CRTAC1 family protein [candidate division Zixibacteria bacterium]
MKIGSFVLILTLAFSGVLQAATIHEAIDQGDSAAVAPVLKANPTADPFTRVTEGPHVSDSTTSSGICWVDYDGDGDLDLYISNQLGLWGGKNFFYENQGDGTYIGRDDLAITQASTNTYSASWGDVDNDGDLDLVVANFRNEASVIYLNDGAGGFTPTSNGPLDEGPVGATNVSWVDFNLDGKLDLFLCNSTGPESGDYPPWENYLFLNTNGTLGRILSGDIATRQRHSYGSSWCDYDGDRDPDLVVPNNSPELTDLYRNDGNGDFTRDASSIICATSSNAGGSSWADYDNDGDMDLFLANFSPGPSALYNNNGDGTFTAIAEHGLGLINGRALGGVWGDYDNDGDQDIFVWLSAWDIEKYEGQLFDNLGNGTFAPAEPGVLQCDSCAAQGAVWGDYDRDGDLDLYISRSELYFPPPTPPRREYATNMLFQNNGNANHWVIIKPVGAVSNRPAFGVKAYVTATISGAPVRQMRELTSQTGRVVQPPLELHFGLGDAAAVDSILVEWPSGLTDTLLNVDGDQFLVVTEGLTLDLDGDGILGGDDNCPLDYNPDQEDTDGVPPGDSCCCRGHSGNANNDPDDKVNISDVSYVLAYLFGIPSGPPPACPAEGNANGGPDSKVNISDVSYLLAYLFGIPSGPPPAACP